MWEMLKLTFFLALFAKGLEISLFLFKNQILGMTKFY